jgi:hypothetical protein
MSEKISSYGVVDIAEKARKARLETEEETKASRSHAYTKTWSGEPVIGHL